jgi:hypothetical protein
VRPSTTYPNLKIIECCLYKEEKEFFVIMLSLRQPKSVAKRSTRFPKTLIRSRSVSRVFTDDVCYTMLKKSLFVGAFRSPLQTLVIVWRNAIIVKNFLCFT